MDIDKFLHRDMPSDFFSPPDPSFDILKLSESPNEMSFSQQSLQPSSPEPCYKETTDLNDWDLGDASPCENEQIKSQPVTQEVTVLQINIIYRSPNKDQKYWRQSAI